MANQLRVVSPADGSVVATLPLAEEARIAEVVEGAASAQAKWRPGPTAARAAGVALRVIQGAKPHSCLRAASDLLRAAASRIRDPAARLCRSGALALSARFERPRAQLSVHRAASP